MPVVGEPSRFAVEYDLNANYGGVWMFGRFCYWCGDQRVGDYELGTSLRDVLFQLDQLAKDRHLRASRRFSLMSAIDIFRRLDTALFGAADLDDPGIADEEQWARHLIVPRMDVFNSWKGFLVEDAQTARLILARDPYIDVTELSLRPGEVDAILDVVRNALDDIYEKESSRRVEGVARQTRGVTRTELQAWRRVAWPTRCRGQMRRVFGEGLSLVRSTTSERDLRLGPARVSIVRA